MKHKLTIILISFLLILGISYMLSAKMQDNKIYSYEWIIEPAEYRHIFWGSENIIVVLDDEGKFGAYDIHANEVLPVKYDLISDFHDGLAVVKENEMFFFVNEKGERLNNDCYEQALGFNEGLAAVKKNDKWGFIDKEGNIVIGFRYDEVKSFSEGIAAVKRDNQWGFINEKGEIVIECSYDGVNSSKEGLIVIQKHDWWGVVDQSGENILECSYEKVCDYSEGLAAVKKNDKWGFIDKEGNVVIGFRYDEVKSFSEGKAAVYIKDKGDVGKWAYVNGNGQIVINYNQYIGVAGLLDYVGEFHDGRAFVSKDLYTMIDDKGKEIFTRENKYQIAYCYYDADYDILPAYIYTDESMKEKRYGLIGIDGEVRLEPVFGYIGEIKIPYVIVWTEEGNKMGVIKLY